MTDMQGDNAAIARAIGWREYWVKGWLRYERPDGTEVKSSRFRPWTSDDDAGVALDAVLAKYPSMMFEMGDFADRRWYARLSRLAGYWYGEGDTRAEAICAALLALAEAEVVSIAGVKVVAADIPKGMAYMAVKREDGTIEGVRIEGLATTEAEA